MRAHSDNDVPPPRAAADAPAGPSSAAPRRLTRWQRVAVLLLLGCGMVLRAWDLGSAPLWVDEAESCTNALTILDHGVPVDTYLSQPIFENTLTKPWPQSAEYEFKDGSYSERGLAIYHGWLPLYAMAGSFKLAGIEPDRDADFRGVRHSPGDLRVRTIAGRLPSLAFGLVFLVVVFRLARAMYGTDAGLVALGVAVVCAPAVGFAREARYYSATLALATCCGLAMWAIARRGAWRDFLGGGVAFALLFHAHMMSFLVAGLAGLLLVPAMARHGRWLLKAAAAAAIVAAAVVPWVVLSGFLGAASDLPPARALMSFPADYLAYARKQYVFVTLGAVALGWIVVAGLLRERLPDRVVRPFVEHRAAFAFLAAWALLAYAAFVLCIPAASYFHRRLTLTLMAPGFVFCVLLFTAAGRAIAGGRRPALAAWAGAAAFACLLALTRQLAPWGLAPTTAAGPTTYDLVEHLRAHPPAPGTRVYATPSDHLTLTFYTGMPVGNVAAARKSYLDGFAGPVLIIEAPRFWPRVHNLREPAWAELVRLAGRGGAELEPALRTLAVREDLAARGFAAEPPLGGLPDALVGAVVERQRAETRREIARAIRSEGNPMFKGFDVSDHGAWWQVFFYRFVDPRNRIGPNLNYAGRIRDARVEVTPGAWVLYHCPGRASD